MNNILKLKHLNLICLFLFVFFVVISYSWIPIIVFSFPLLMVLQFNLSKLKILNFVFVLYILLIAMILITLDKQTVYIEWARNLIFIPLIIVSYFIGNLLAENNYYTKKIFLMFLFSSAFLVFYTFLFVIPFDLPLFLSERRGYSAREFLLFGRFYEFSLGVTHLNMYINFVFSLLLVSLIFRKKMYFYVLIGIFVVLALLTQSRSPILFLFIISMIFILYQYQISKQKFNFLVAGVFVFVLMIVLVGTLFYIKSGGSDSRFTAEGMSDMSRLIFYAKGLEHLTLEPWGNSLLYTDERMPLLNYHNTFLALGNRMGMVSLICFVTLFCVLIVRVRGITDSKVRTSLYILAYFCFHNFMIEDVIKFDGFVILLFFILVPYVRRYYFIQEGFKINE
jgi:hypothetical protein